MGKGAGGASLPPPTLAGPVALGGPEDAPPPEQHVQGDATAQQCSATERSQLLTPPGQANLRSALGGRTDSRRRGWGPGEEGLQEARKGAALLCDVNQLCHLHQGRHTFSVQGQRVGILDLLLTVSTATT